MSIKAKIIRSRELRLNSLYRYIRRCDSSITAILYDINCIHNIFIKQKLRLIHNASSFSNNLIVEKTTINQVDALNEYRLTKFGSNLFKLFYDLNYKNLPKEFVIYYDNNSNDINTDATIFTLKLMKNNNNES
jgi:hypothetical protein